MHSNTNSGYSINYGLWLQHRVLPHLLGMRKGAFNKVQILTGGDRHRVLNSTLYQLSQALHEYQRHIFWKEVTIFLQLSQDEAMGWNKAVRADLVERGFLKHRQFQKILSVRTLQTYLKFSYVNDDFDRIVRNTCEYHIPTKTCSLAHLSLLPLHWQFHLAYCIGQVLTFCSIFFLVVLLSTHYSLTLSCINMYIFEPCVPQELSCNVNSHSKYHL